VIFALAEVMKRKVNVSKIYLKILEAGIPWSY
jgi:hypothetical protein